jgi:serine/threonine-protein kinase
VTVADASLILSAPHSLPGGRALLVTVITENATGRVAVLDLETGRVRQFGPGFGATFAAGHLVYASRTGELFRQPFDVAQATPAGTAEQIASGLDVVLGWSSFGFDVSTEGSLVYLVGSRSLGTERRNLALVDSAGREPRVIPARVPWEPRFSPDGRRLAYGAYAPGRDSSDIWVTDLESGATRRLTSDVQDNNDPVWSPNGRSIAYDRNAPGGKDVMVESLEGGTPRRLISRPGTQWPTDWLRDGSAVLFTERDPGGQLDIWLQPIDGGPARPVVATPAQELAGRISPDGGWMAYESDETGRNEIYVRPFPAPGRATLVSATGGVNPVWGRDGRTLYYWQLDQLFAASVEAGGPGAPLIVRKRSPLFRAPFVGNILQNYDVSPDGKRFAVVLGEGRPSRLVVAIDALGSRGSMSAASP